MILKEERSSLRVPLGDVDIFDVGVFNLVLSKYLPCGGVLVLRYSISPENPLWQSGHETQNRV